jgi:hypothetical protein
MKSSFRLPRTIHFKDQKKKICQALDDDGVRCRKHAMYQIAFIGDHEIYHTHERAIEWAVIYVCGEHLPYGDLESLLSKEKRL